MNHSIELNKSVYNEQHDNMTRNIKEEFSGVHPVILAELKLYYL